MKLLVILHDLVRLEEWDEVSPLRGHADAAKLDSMIVAL